MKRTKTIRVKLTVDQMVTFGVDIPCCGRRVWYSREDFNPGDIWCCKHCGKPLIVVNDDGIPYFVGGPVFL